MAFIVEDGTQVADANAYMTVAEFKAFQVDRGRDYGTKTDPQIEQAIVLSTDYLDKRFNLRYIGEKAGTIQGREWPRNSATDRYGRLITGMPDALLYATAEYTYLVLTLGTELAPVPSDVAGSITEEKTGPLTTKYGQGSKPMTSTGNQTQNIPEYPVADLWVEQLLVSVSSRRLARG